MGLIAAVKKRIGPPPQAGEGSAPEVAVEGVRAGEWPDEEAVYRAALAEWEATRALETRKAAQTLRFSHGPVALVCMGDLHLGGAGVDYPRLFREAETIVQTPGVAVALLGDVLDNYIVNSLIAYQMENRISIPDEWALVRRFLRVMGDSIRIVVEGNHDAWTRRLSGVDYFREVAAESCARAIFARYDCRVNLTVGEATWPGRLRHKWRGNSIYNPTHGIERANKWEQDFVWGVGAHTHRGGFTRAFNAGGSDGMAALVGSYKRVDGYAAREGFPRPNNSTAVAIVFDERHGGSMTGFENLGACLDYMRAMYG